jgi:uncharacterized membrane protein
MTPETERNDRPAPTAAFRGAVLRGLGVVLPPLLTIVIFLWMGGTVETYVLEPMTAGTQRFAIWVIEDIRQDESIPSDQRGNATPIVGGTTYQRLENGEYVPKAVFDVVKHHPGDEGLPKTAMQAYRAYVRLTYLRPYLVIPAFILVFTLLLYLLGKFMAAGIGSFFIGLFEGMIRRVPLVRNVYSAVKQVSGFVLNDRQMQVSRVVAVEYPRKGIWQIGLVTGEAIPDIEAMVGERCLTVLICTSPMPMAGFAVTVRRSECLDLNLTLDQAIQFIVSCGVIVPGPKVLDADETAENPASVGHRLPSPEIDVGGSTDPKAVVP